MRKYSTEQEVRSIQKSPDTLIKAYYEECIPVFQSSKPNKENLSRIYSLEKLTIYKYNKTAEVQATQTSNNVKKILEKVGIEMLTTCRRPVIISHTANNCIPSLLLNFILFTTFVL